MGEDKPNPLADAVKGLGLLFRAAKTVVERIPTKNLETTVVESAREVGRAVENVASAIEREVLGKRDDGREVLGKRDDRREVLGKRDRRSEKRDEPARRGPSEEPGDKDEKSGGDESG